MPPLHALRDAIYDIVTSATSEEEVVAKWNRMGFAVHYLDGNVQNRLHCNLEVVSLQTAIDNIDDDEYVTDLFDGLTWRERALAKSKEWRAQVRVVDGFKEPVDDHSLVLTA